MSDPDGASILTMPGIEPEPADSRFVYPRLPISNPGDATSVQVLLAPQAAASTPMWPTWRRPPRSLVTDSTVRADPLQDAARRDGQRRSPTCSWARLPRSVGLVNDDLTNGLHPPGARRLHRRRDDQQRRHDGQRRRFRWLTDRGEIRVGQKVVQDAGLNPNLVIVGSQDALELDLPRSVPTGDYLLDLSPRANGATPLFGMSGRWWLASASPC